jgi:XapX domain-containing protein
MATSQSLKVGLGLLLGFSIGVGCRLAHIPSPAPTALIGALLVLAMTTGWTLVDRLFSHRPKNSEPLCGGPAGTPPVRDAE